MNNIYGIHCYITYNRISNNTIIFHIKVKYIKQYLLCFVQNNTNKHSINIKIKISKILE